MMSQYQDLARNDNARLEETVIDVKWAIDDRFHQVCVLGAENSVCEIEWCLAYPKWRFLVTREAIR